MFISRGYLWQSPAYLSSCAALYRSLQTTCSNNPKNQHNPQLPTLNKEKPMAVGRLPGYLTETPRSWSLRKTIPMLPLNKNKTISLGFQDH